MNNIFIILCIIHVLIWLFIITAFINKTTAEINLYYLIPLIYVLHIFPFHIIIKMKEYAEPENTIEKIKDFENNNIITKIYWDIYRYLSYSTFNPLTPQGMMIFGAISSDWALKVDKFFI
jgi:hypothetical protein